VRRDSFVVETDLHYPTDTNLPLDAVRRSESPLDTPPGVWSAGRLRAVAAGRRGRQNGQGCRVTSLPAVTLGVSGTESSHCPDAADPRVNDIC
jgi:hypothetical protein